MILRRKLLTVVVKPSCAAARSVARELSLSLPPSRRGGTSSSVVA